MRCGNSVTIRPRRSGRSRFHERARSDAGRRFCFLYTDLANKIYRSIGYEPIAQSVRVEFDPTATAR